MLLHKGEPLIIEREKTTIFKDHDIPQIIYYTQIGPLYVELKKAAPARLEGMYRTTPGLLAQSVQRPQDTFRPGSGA